jgi:hypothetical protein
MTRPPIDGGGGSKHENEHMHTKSRSDPPTASDSAASPLALTRRQRHTGPDVRCTAGPRPSWPRTAGRRGESQSRRRTKTSAAGGACRPVPHAAHWWCAVVIRAVLTANVGFGDSKTSAVEAHGMLDQDRPTRRLALPRRRRTPKACLAANGLAVGGGAPRVFWGVGAEPARFGLRA